MNVNSMKAKVVIAMSKPLVLPITANRHFTNVYVTRDTKVMVLNVSKVYYYFESNGLLTLARFKSF